MSPETPAATPPPEPPAGDPAGVPAAAFVHRQRVRYFEVDQQGVVFNSWYLAYLDEAMTAWLEQGDLRYTALMDAGFDVQLVRSEIDWRGSLGWGDVAEITIEPVHRGRTSFTLSFAIGARPEGGSRREVATARTVYVAIATDGSGPVVIPPLLDALLADAPDGPRPG